MIDWAALGKETIEVLRRYLMVDEIRRVHGNDERVSLENITAGVRAYTEMLLAVAGA